MLLLIILPYMVRFPSRKYDQQPVIIVIWSENYYRPLKNYTTISFYY